MQATFALWVVSGILALLAFFLPESVGTSLTGRGVLLVAMTFVGSGLVYLCLIPVTQPGSVST